MRFDLSERIIWAGPNTMIYFHWTWKKNNYCRMHHLWIRQSVLNVDNVIVIAALLYNNLAMTSPYWCPPSRLCLFALDRASECQMSYASTLKPRHNGRHFPDDIFKCIFVNEYVWILNTIWLKFVYKGLIDNSTPLVQIMTIIWTNDELGRWLVCASFGLNELYHQPQRTIWGSCLFEMPWFHSCATPPAIAIPTSLILSWPT